MAGSKEIRTKIKSIQSTQKITRAMEMVAASKMRRAQDRVRASRPYADRIREVIAHLTQGHLEYRHPFMMERSVKRVGYIVISSDRGLCGGLNSNLFKRCIQEMKQWSQDQVPIDLVVVGRKAELFFKRYNGKVIGSVTGMGDVPVLKDLIGIVKLMLDLYREEKLDRLFLASNNFVNTMVQKPAVEQLLPIVDTEAHSKRQQQWDYIYEPSAEELLENLLIRYVESLVYQGVVENGACEQAARMVAMKSASDNASELISEFRLLYNKARQAAITQELSEIVAGAAAV